MRVLKFQCAGSEATHSPLASIWKVPQHVTGMVPHVHTVSKKFSENDGSILLLSSFLLVCKPSEKKEIIAISIIILIMFLKLRILLRNY